MRHLTTQKKHRQPMQTDRAMEDADKVVDSPKHSRRRQSRQQTQMEQTTKDADEQTTHQNIANIDGASHGKHRQANDSPRHSRRRRSKLQKKQISKQFTKAEQTQTERTRYRGCNNGQNTDIEGVTSSDGNSNIKTRHSTKIVSFFINDIIGYTVISYNLQLK